MTRGQFLETSMGWSLTSSLGLRGFPFDKDPKNQSGNHLQSFVRTAEMKRNYEVALHILNPTQKDLEHGLDLHKNSLVYDTYGFMPRAAQDGAAIAKAINDNASALELQDMREDMSMSRMAENERERKEFINAWNASGVTCMFQNAAYSCNTIDKLIKRLSRFTYTTEKMKDFIGRAFSPAEIIQAKNENKKALYLTGNGVPLPQEWITVEEELRYIRIFYQLGIRMLHLTYNRRNVIGDGCGEPTDAGLSDFGRTVVKEMNRVGIIVDIAHSGWQTSLDAARFSEKPMVASHSSVTALHNVVRSKTDEIIKAIADTDGYIGICCIPRYLGGSGDIAAFLHHIDYVAKKFGSDYATIGTDVAYTSQYDKMEREITDSMQTKSPPVTRTRFAALWPEEAPFTTTPEMNQSMAWTNWPLFTVGLVQKGYSDTDIQKIIGGNAMRVAQAAFV